MGKIADSASSTKVKSSVPINKYSPNTRGIKFELTPEDAAAFATKLLLVAQDENAVLNGTVKIFVDNKSSIISAMRLKKK